MAEAVATGSCLVFIRSITAIGCDSSTRGGSFTGKNTSRTLPQRDAKTPSSSMIRSFFTGCDSSCSGASFDVLNASRRFAKSEVHMDPSVSSFKLGASAGRSVGPDFPGSISGGGVNTVLSIGCFASGAVGRAFRLPISNRAPVFPHFNHARSPPVSLLPQHTAHSFQKTFYKHSPTRARYVGRTRPWDVSSALPSSSLQPGYNRSLAQTALLLPRSLLEERMPEQLQGKPEPKALKSTLNLPIGGEENALAPAPKLL